MTQPADSAHANPGGGPGPAPGTSGRLVRELMIWPAVVVPGRATVAEALRLLTTAHVAGAPVVEGQRVVGVVTLADLHRWTTEADPELLEEPARVFRSLGLRLDRVEVDRLLPRMAVTARSDWPASRALAVLLRAGFQRLPVVDDAGRLVGIIARDVLLAAGVQAPMLP